jgi:hypothetical protein
VPQFRRIVRPRVHSVASAKVVCDRLGDGRGVEV